MTGCFELCCCGTFFFVFFIFLLIAGILDYLVFIMPFGVSVRFVECSGYSSGDMTLYQRPAFKSACIK